MTLAGQRCCSTCPSGSIHARALRGAAFRSHGGGSCRVYGNGSKRIFCTTSSRRGKTRLKSNFSTVEQPSEPFRAEWIPQMRPPSESSRQAMDAGLPSRMSTEEILEKLLMPLSPTVPDITFPSILDDPQSLTEPDEPPDRLQQAPPIPESYSDLSDNVESSSSKRRLESTQAESSATAANAAEPTFRKSKAAAVSIRAVRQIMRQTKPVRLPHDHHDLEGTSARTKIAVKAMRMILTVHQAETERCKAAALPLCESLNPH